MSYAELAHLVTFRPLSMRLEYVGGTMPSPFSASWSSTVELLAREIRHLKPKQALIELDMREQDFRIDGLPKANARAMTPGVVLTLVGTPHGDLRYPCTRFTYWDDNVRAIALALEALRKVDRYGVTKRGEQYAGWKALPAGENTQEALYIKGKKIVDEQYRGDRRLALRDTHPDRGGTHERFVAVRAYDESLQAAGR